MIEKEYCIVGGGAAGVGFLDGLIERGIENVVLIEGRNELMYTLTWLKYVKKKFQGDPVSGAQFREKISSRNRPANLIVTGARVMNVEPEKNLVHFFYNDTLKSCKYRYLVLAAGGVPIIYGEYLLPGYRGAGIFSAYQVGEMLVHFDFKPGKKLVIYGEDEYAVDLAYLARDCGIDVVVVSPVDLEVEDIDFHSGSIKLLRGDLRLEEVVFESGKVISCDSLAIAGKFVPERWWRESGIVKWDLKKWQGSSPYENIILVGDMRKPSFDFVEQYEKAHEAGRSVK